MDMPELIRAYGEAGKELETLEAIVELLIVELLNAENQEQSRLLGRSATMTKPRLDQGPDYERGFIDGMQHQMQSSVDKAVNGMAKPEQEPVEHTTGHCENHKQKGGCQLHNLQCGWPDCDRKPITASPQPEPVAWTDENFTDIYVSEDIAKDCGATVKLYSTPQRKPWVGLHKTGTERS